MAKAADVYFQVDPWKVIEQGFDPAYARVSESIFSLGMSIAFAERIPMASMIWRS